MEKLIQILVKSTLSRFRLVSCCLCQDIPWP